MPTPSESTFETLIQAVETSAAAINGNPTYWFDMTATDALVRRGLLPLEQISVTPTIMLEFLPTDTEEGPSAGRQTIINLYVEGVTRGETQTDGPGNLHREGIRLLQDIVTKLETDLSANASTCGAWFDELDVYVDEDSGFAVARALLRMRYRRGKGAL